MKKLVLSLVAIGLFTTSAFAKKVSVCNVLRNYSTGIMKIDCGNGHTTLKKMYKKGWRFVGSALSGSGGAQLILEK